MFDVNDGVVSRALPTDPSGPIQVILDYVGGKNKDIKALTIAVYDLVGWGLGLAFGKVTFKGDVSSLLNQVLQHPEAVAALPPFVLPLLFQLAQLILNSLRK